MPTSDEFRKRLQDLRSRRFPPRKAKSAAAKKAEKSSVGKSVKVLKCGSKSGAKAAKAAEVDPKISQSSVGDTPGELEREKGVGRAREELDEFTEYSSDG